MTTHQGVRVTSSTSGSPAPGIEELSGGYRWRKTPGWEPGDPRFQDQPARAVPSVTQDRARRLARFGEYRAQGLSIPEAGRRMGVKEKTAYAYERDWRHLQRQQGGTS